LRAFSPHRRRSKKPLLLDKENIMFARIRALFPSMAPTTLQDLRHNRDFSLFIEKEPMSAAEMRISWHIRYWLI
jgi:hypothetical protein